MYCETAKVVSPCKKLNVNYFTVLSYVGHYVMQTIVYTFQ